MLEVPTNPTWNGQYQDLLCEGFGPTAELGIHTATREDIYRSVLGNISWGQVIPPGDDIWECIGEH